MHHWLDVNILRSDPLNANIFGPSVGNRFGHIFEFGGCESLHEVVVVRILVGLHAGVNQPLHSGADDLVHDLVV